MPDLAAMRAAAAELEDYLEQALDTITEPRDTYPQERADRSDLLVNGYLQLAGIALERFEEAAGHQGASHGA